MTRLYADEVFAPLDRDYHVERVAGGNETEVYRTDDQAYVIKLKSDLGGTVADSVELAREMRFAAERFTECLGSNHSIPSYYLISRDSDGHVQVLVLQPFLAQARQLYDIDYSTLSKAERVCIASQLRDIISRSLVFYRNTGSMPDLYGRTSTSKAERAHLNKTHMLPWRLWSFLVRRNLLRSHNLMLTDAPERRIILVDYDIVRRSKLYKRVYYAVRWFLFWRDHTLIELMRRSGFVPKRQKPSKKKQG
ncbi:MAG: hypothetical protein GFH27_549311n168 [Chloroflexi bacterium AL-W]|nr:hypothetical protein [Chloroflexi bacterium AL-N1]NOK68654.1 hypothetical protein [Chloroflexi bacterium AL-N10]NOK76140.1 hypothetical protein [Chloroflexi bacterium AL-N5]NOK84223.1 hypothetical protein [Chloroflexi bacterium AL-W]NOK91278.1 hypothetical protein [Chloroflexi bacterium AL-N15]